MSDSPSSHSRIVPSNPNLTRIALFTDSHFWPNGGNFEGFDGNIQPLGHSEEIMEKLSASIRAAKPDLAVHLGDFTCGGGTYAMTDEDFENAIDTVSSVLHQLPFAAYGLPGNHDCPPGGGDWSYFEKRWSMRRGMGMTVDTPQVRLILVNTQGHTDEQISAARPRDPVRGWTTDAELERVDQALSTAGKRPVIVMMHQLVLPWNGEQPWADYYGIGNGERLIDILGRYGNVRAVFQGHAHRLDVQEAPLGGANTLFVITPSLVEYPFAWLQLTISHSTLAFRLHCLPMADVAEQSLHSGSGQGWRIGKQAWQNVSIALNGSG